MTAYEQARPHRLGADLGRHLRHLDPRLVFAARAGAVAAFAVYNTFWLFQIALYARNGFPLNDWDLLSKVDLANPYAAAEFHWSMPALWAWQLIEPMGFGLWSALHVAAIMTLPRKVALVALVTFPLWADIAAGNMVTFALVLAWHALEGRRWAVVGFCVLTAFIPRPLMIPVLAVLLWRSWDARVAFVLGGLAALVAGLATGTLTAYVGSILGTSSAGWYSAPWNIGPSAFIGAAWVPVGLLLGVLAAWRGRLGLASLAVSPYLIHYYAMFGLLELRSPRSRGDTASTMQPSRPPGS